MPLAQDNSTITLPAQERTVTTLSAYLANNALFNVVDYGARADGDPATNNGAAFAAADAAAQLVNRAALYVPAGIRGYVFSGNTTITSPIVFAAGALLQPAAGDVGQ